MPYKNLRQFIEKLDASGELHRIKTEVDPVLEITEITDRISKSNGPALLFEKVKGFSYPLIINAFGSYKRMQLALSCNSFDEIAARLESSIKIRPPEGLMGKIKMLFTLKEMAALIPKKVKKAACQEKVITDGPLLDILPIIQCWPYDGGPFITLPIVITKDPETGIQNAGMYRMQKYDNSSTGMHWQYNKDGTRHFDKYKNLNRRMDVAVALGGAPSVTYAATAPLPPDIDELVFAGFLDSKPVEIVKAKTVDLYVPAESDFIIEGYVDPDEERIEGPFGDHTGFYSAADIYPVFHVTAVTCRNDAIYPATIVGKPPMEDCFMAKATERIFLTLLKFVFPEIVDMELPLEGVFHNCALVSINKKYPGQAKKIINALWGIGQMASTKFIAVFDQDINLQDSSTVVWKLLNNVDPRRDLIFSEGPLDALDHSAPFANFGGKMGIDATRKTREEGMGREWPDEIVMSEEVKEKVTKRWKEYGF
ncbi:menaquinone biosynthesis decarboxylase [Desulfobacterium sp. N47]|uniref:menaquinone biosynthesis decarboxylase n=1 Tax=Desulfobacterium sp. N47 TaxID=3115210 RepID=UPI003C9785A3